MSRRRWKDEDFIKAVKESISVAETLRAIGLQVTGSNYKTVHRTVARMGLNTDHWLGQSHLQGKSHKWTKKTPLTEIMLENSTYGSTSSLKSRMVREGILTYECAVCGISSWLGRPITLQLDHINGVNNDHRRENLRLLCPNCHSCTPTFAGRNILKVAKSDSICKRCGDKVSKLRFMCRKCAASERPTKIDWPGKETLSEMLESMGMGDVGRRLGVSGNAIRKHMKRGEGDHGRI